MLILKGKGLILFLIIIKKNVLNKIIYLKIRVGFCIDYYLSIFVFFFIKYVEIICGDILFFFFYSRSFFFLKKI